MCKKPVGSAYDFAFETLAGNQSLPLSQFKGSVILIVNTASKCGFTPQYQALEALYQQCKTKGLVIIGVPCDDFGHQEPGSSEDIANFCQINYGVSFPMTQKVHAKGPNTHPFYEWAKKTLGFGSGPKWNFHKYLVDREGHLVDYFHTFTKPLSKRVVTKIEELL